MNSTSILADQIDRSLAADTTIYGSSERNTHAYGDWERVIIRLLEWSKNPGGLLDEDYVPPERKILDLAITVAHWAHEKKWMPPTNVVPDGGGGVAFERKAGAVFQTLLITSDEQVKCLTFKDFCLSEKTVLERDYFVDANVYGGSGETAETKAPLKEAA